jgi:hypothetical protein
VYAHIVGTSQEKDILVYEDGDETSFVDISNTKDMVIISVFHLLNARLQH